MVQSTAETCMASSGTELLLGTWAGVGPGPAGLTFLSAGGRLPGERPLVEERAAGHVLAAEGPAVLRPARGLGLQPGRDLPQPGRRLVLVDLGVHLGDGVLDEAQGLHQRLVLLRVCSHAWVWGEEVDKKNAHHALH